MYALNISVGARDVLSIQFAELSRERQETQITARALICFKMSARSTLSSRPNYNANQTSRHSHIELANHPDIKWRKKQLALSDQLKVLLFFLLLFFLLLLLSSLLLHLLLFQSHLIILFFFFFLFYPASRFFSVSASSSSSLWMILSNLCSLSLYKLTSRIPSYFDIILMYGRSIKYSSCAITFSRLVPHFFLYLFYFFYVFLPCFF